jgi:hypothetical protein
MRKLQAPLGNGVVCSAAMEPALDSGLDLAAGCCEAFAAADDDAMGAGVAGFRRQGEAGFEGRLGFIVLLNPGAARLTDGIF